MQRAWVGIDAGKEHHWAVVVDEDGRVVLSRRVLNDEAEFEQLLAQVRGLAGDLTWAVDLTNGYVGLLLAVLWDAGQRVLYLPGKAVNRAADGYRSEGKTDAKDARVIADQARMRRDLAQLKPRAELRTELALLVRHRRDLATDKQRMIVRLRELLSALCPAVERALDYNRKGPQLLISRWQTPQAIRKAGVTRMTAFLEKHRIPRAAQLADKAIQAAAQQTRHLPGEDLTAQLVSELAVGLLAIRAQLKTVDQEIQNRVARHEQGEIITSLPGMGTLLTAEFIVAVGDLDNFTSADHLAAYAGLAPVPKDSGRSTGNLHRPQRYNRALMRVFYLSAQAVIGRPGASRDYYQRKRAENKRHIQAVIALARRRVNVMWAMLRDNRSYIEPASTALQAA
ncbi:MAG: IS110 family transposase [Actinomadura sp.]